MAIYTSESPAQSSSSLSDIDDDGDRNDFVAQKVQPARWSSSAYANTRAANNSPRRRSRLQAAAHSPVSRLPPELLIHVLKQLGTLRDLHTSLLVSRQWCECAIQLVWHKPHIRDERGLHRLLRILDRPDPSFTYADFIRRLNLSMLYNDVTNHDVARLVVCSKLERLTLMNCKAINDDSLVMLFAYTPELIAVDLCGVTDASDNTMFALSKTATKLQGLNITNCKRVSDNGIIAVARSCRFLRRFKLACVDKVTDKSLVALASSCHKLLELDLTRCPHISDVGLRELWSQLFDLRELKISYCATLSEAAHPSVPPSVANLFGPPAALDLPPLLLHHIFDHFRILELSGCPLVTDEAIAGIVAHAPKIRSLSLAKCSQLSDNALESIAKLGRHLHDLHLGHVNRITDIAVCQLARSCTRLRYVDLACCNNLTDMTVIELSQLPKLRRIGLVRVTRLTDQAVFALGDRHGTLERIHLSYCDNITIPAIHYLLQRLPKLMHLSLTGIPSFRTADLQQFCRQPPQEFTDNQRAAFCVFSGKGVHELRAHLQDVMAQITDGVGGGRATDTEDDDMDDDDDEGDYSGMPLGAPSLLDSREAQMAFLSAPNALVGPALHATLQGLRQNSYASSSSMTTPDGATPRAAGSMHNLGNGWNQAELAETLRRRLPLREDSSSSTRRQVPFPEAMQVDRPQPGPSTQRHHAHEADESRGRRVRRSLRNTLNAAEQMLFGRAGSSSGRAGGSGGGGR